LGLVNPLAALVLSLGVLILMMFKRVRLGLALNIVAIMFALLSIDVGEVPRALYSSVDPSTIDGQLALSIIIASFGIMLLSQLYKDSGTIDLLNRSLESVLRNPKAVLIVIPAVIGLLPVPGGALMSAPVVDAEGDKFGFSRPKKVYVNIWFRHLIFPIYPLSPVFMIAMALIGVGVTALISMAIPAIAVMAVVGYATSFIGARRSSRVGGLLRKGASARDFLGAFSPIAVSIVGAIVLGLLSHELSRRGLDVLIAVFAGLLTLAVIAKATFKDLVNVLKRSTAYDVALATLGAFLIRGAVRASGLSEAIKGLVLSDGPSLLLVVTISTLCSFGLGSVSAGLAISVPVLRDSIGASFGELGLMYMTACLGYIVSPLHLCLLFTVDYFKTNLREVYRAMLPSFFASLVAITVFYALV